MVIALLNEHYRLTQEIQNIEQENENRKRLIRLCVLKVLTLNQIPPPKTTGPASPENALPEKLHEYELRISVLKQQLSTKEKVHEAQVDELKELVAHLQKQVEEKKDPKLRLGPKFLSPPTSAGHPRSISVGNRPFSASLKSTFSQPFFSPVTKPNILGGKGNSFAATGKSPGFGANFASQASWKLSQTEDAKKDAFFSSPNTSTSVESTPSRNKLSETADDPSANLTLANLSHNTSDDTFVSANGSLGQFTLKKKKKRIQLLSSEASRLMVDNQGKGLHVEDEDLNSLNYYQDDNFKEDTTVSPVRTKRPLEDAEEPPRKKHVFKI